MRRMALPVLVKSCLMAIGSVSWMVQNPTVGRCLKRSDEKPKGTKVSLPYNKSAR